MDPALGSPFRLLWGVNRGREWRGAQEAASCCWEGSEAGGRPTAHGCHVLLLPHHARAQIGGVAPRWGGPHSSLLGLAET